MRIFVVFVVLTIVMSLSLPVYAGELDELKALVRQLQQRIEQLEKNQKTEPAIQSTQSGQSAAQTSVVDKGQSAPKPVIAGTMPGSFMIPGTDTSLKIYGNARIDATYDFKGRSNDILDNDWASAVFAQPFDTNVSNKPREKQFYATARASRLGFMSSTPTPLSDLEIRLEADFNAPNDYMGEFGSNGTMFRLRHAYGKIGGLLIGQTWSNFIDFRSVPETVDFNPPGSATLIRQAQLRYTMPIGPTTLALSIENPESITELPPVQILSNSVRNDFDQVPNFVANWSYNAENAHISLRGAAFQYKNDFHSKGGYALAMGGSVKLGPGILMANIQGGNGIGRYMFNSLLQGATETGTDLRLWKALGWHVGYSIPWSSALRSSFIISRTTFSEDTEADTFQRAAWLGKVDEFIPNKRVDQAFINLIWGVTKNVEAGVEYAYGRRITFGDERGTQQRINMMIQYNLN